MGDGVVVVGGTLRRKASANQVRLFVARSAYICSPVRLNSSASDGNML